MKDPELEALAAMALEWHPAFREAQGFGEAPDRVRRVAAAPAIVSQAKFPGTNGRALVIDGEEASGSR